ncbi:hypothetical protein, partial [Phocaeicola plebeius]|uniref:hypothetical protein n=1 Tax=Phocaeicola plebeius TaxID=310297 RepID=UPI0026ECF624
MSLVSCSYSFIRGTKVENHTRFLDTQNAANQRERILFGGDVWSQRNNLRGKSDKFISLPE